MSLKKNIIASYVSQIYVTLIGIVIMPLYIKYMGAEAYGLVGFFALLQAWFNLLDLGLTPTIGRETARFRAGVGDALGFRQLFRALNSIFLLIAFIGGGGLFLFSGFIADDWLKVQDLPLAEVQLAVQIMVISVALRWISGLYRGVIIGAEMLVWLGGFNAVLATLRFVLVLPVMWHFGATPTVFFSYQLLIAILQIAILGFKTRLLLPVLDVQKNIGWSFAPVKPLLKFALTIAFTSSVWVLVTQTDKLVLSGILLLEEYGYFALAVLVASSIMVVGGPISNVIMHRMARLHAEGKHEELIRVYRNSTQLVSIIAGSAAIILACCAKPLLFAWTGDAQLASKAAPILRLYAIGNGFLAVASFPYYLQYAKGNLRYHLIGNIGMVVVLIPCIVFAGINYGGVGAGYVWLVMNGLFLLIWGAYVHKKLEPGLHCTWLISDVLKITLLPILIAFFTGTIDFELSERLENLFYVALVGCLITTCALLCSDLAKRALKCFEVV